MMGQTNLNGTRNLTMTKTLMITRLDNKYELEVTDRTGW